MMPGRAPLGPVVLHMGDPVACTYLNMGGVVNAMRISGDKAQGHCFDCIQIGNNYT